MEGYIGQIILFAGNFAPRNWAFCNGALLPIASYNATFSILGTLYGGDGRTTFGLPDLRARVPIGAGDGPGLGSHSVGAKGGSKTNTLQVNQLPSHGHPLTTGTVTIPISADAADQSEGPGNFLANGTFYHDSPGAAYGNGAIPLAGNSANVGGNQPVNNMPPYQAINYIICLIGTYPSRN